MRHYQKDLDPNKKKVTTPLVITHFNQNMALLMINVCFLMYFVLCEVHIPNWLMLMLQCSMWMLWSCGIILILGYFVAICDRNVIVIEDKRKDKTSNKKEQK